MSPAAAAARALAMPATLAARHCEDKMFSSSSAQILDNTLIATIIVPVVVLIAVVVIIARLCARRQPVDWSNARPHRRRRPGL